VSRSAKGGAEPSRSRWLSRFDGIFEQKISALAKLVYLALLRHADDDFRCYPSAVRLAQLTRMCLRSVRGALNQLRRARLITVIKVKRSRRRDLNIYQLPSFPVSAPDALTSPSYCTTCTNVSAPGALEGTQYEVRKVSPNQTDTVSAPNALTDPPAGLRGLNGKLNGRAKHAAAR
jgi:hypothetical protein